jgi:hypothetical protein
MSKLTKVLEKHLTHEVRVVFTPNKIHYAKLCCVACNNLHLQWLSPDQLVQIGQITEQEKQELVNLKRHRVQQLQNQGKYKKKSNWSNITTQERTFYKRYQPPILQRGRTPSQLIGDRLCLEGRSRYNGNSIHAIPIEYLKLIMAQNKIGNSDDKKYIMATIKARRGADLSPSIAQ